MSNPLTFAPTPEMPMPMRRANLPTFAEISASVLVDEAWVQGEQESLDLVRELVSINQSEATLLVLTNQVTSSISSASSSRVSIEFIEFRQRKRLLSDVCVQTFHTSPQSSSNVANLPREVTYVF